MRNIQKYCGKFYHGSAWCSITKEFADFLVINESNIKKLFKYGYCVDEIFIQTIILNSSFAETLYNDNLRLIDWTHGNPHVWTVEDIDIIKKSNCLFARKFDSTIDNEVIKAVIHMLE